MPASSAACGSSSSCAWTPKYSWASDSIPWAPAAEVRGVQVAREDLVLGQLVLELPGDARLGDLALERACSPRGGVLCQLLRDGRATLHDASVAHVADQGAAQRPHVDAPVGPEPHVLDGDDGIEQHRGDLVERDGVTLTVADQLGQAAAVGVDDNGGLPRLRDRDGAQRAELDQVAAAGQQHREQDDDDRERTAAVHGGIRRDGAR